ncbi:MAG: hypothetical protein WKF36_01310 [Candidatus Nitrosocosmicus sp.]
MGWIRVCEENSLNDGDLKEFDHNDAKILIARLKDKIYLLIGYALMRMLTFRQDF